MRERRDELVESHLALVRPIAEGIRRSLPGSFELDDLIQAGAVGLVRAATRYQPARHGGAPFTAFAKRHIRGAILDSVRRKNWVEATRMEPLEEAPEPALAPVIDISIDRDKRLEKVKVAIRNLDPSKRKIVEIYYSGEDRRLEDAGEAVGLKKSRAHELHHEALEDLRRILRVR
ncbi:MAG: sigma-70 family RNA polymerase sigma factor [Streptosporangiaceae bacterium]|nr:sigma-70 family RNA polymerase sigma factor [Streptosporangiaceae bacterium]